MYTAGKGRSMLRHAWLIAAFVAEPLSAQSGPQGDTWESIAKLPDFGGLWEVTFGIVERFRLAAADRLEVEVTIEDPEALTKPWAEQ